MPVPRKYLPLDWYLAQLPGDQTSVTLSFTDLEALLGAPLPQSLQSGPGGYCATQYWWRSGFNAKLDRVDRTVTFTRRL